MYVCRQCFFVVSPGRDRANCRGRRVTLYATKTLEGWYKIVLCYYTVCVLDVCMYVFIYQRVFLFLTGWLIHQSIYECHNLLFSSYLWMHLCMYVLYILHMQKLFFADAFGVIDLTLCTFIRALGWACISFWIWCRRSWSTNSKRSKKLLIKWKLLNKRVRKSYYYEWIYVMYVCMYVCMWLQQVKRTPRRQL